MGKNLKVGIAGLGTVGAATARILIEKSGHLLARSGCNFELTSVCARDRSKDRGIDLSEFNWHDDPVALAASPDIDIFVELIGGEDGPALDAINAALDNGKHVVTANKALVATHGEMLAKKAESKNLAIGYESAVAGGIPVINAIRDSLAGNKVSRIFGILNGTCNYILTRMEKDRLSFADALTEAQSLGYAEADPTFDVAGNDTAHKLAILTSLAFGTKINLDAVYIEGIENITPEDIASAARLGYAIKLLGVALETDSGIEQRVHPTLVLRSALIAQVSGVTNAVAIDGDEVGEVLLVGAGAGGDATASAVIGDLIGIGFGQVRPVFGRPGSSMNPHVQARLRAHEGGYFIRLNVHDHPGAFAAIAARMAEQDISLEHIVQHHEDHDADSGRQSVTIITHETMEEHVRVALSAIREDGHIDNEPQMIRIER